MPRPRSRRFSADLTASGREAGADEPSAGPAGPTRQLANQRIPPIGVDGIIPGAPTAPPGAGPPGAAAGAAGAAGEPIAGTGENPPPTGGAARPPAPSGGGTDGVTGEPATPGA